MSFFQNLCKLCLILGIFSVTAYAEDFSAPEAQNLFQLTHGHGFRCQDSNRQVVLSVRFQQAGSELKMQLGSAAFGDNQGNVTLKRLETQGRILMELHPSTASAETVWAQLRLATEFRGIVGCSEGQYAVYSRNLAGQDVMKLQGGLICCLD